MQPNEKNALEMFSVMDFIGLKSEVHQVPRHLDAVVGSDQLDDPSSLHRAGHKQQQGAEKREERCRCRYTQTLTTKKELFGIDQSQESV